MRVLAALVLTLIPLNLAAQIKDTPMPHHATGTFTVDLKPLTPAPAEGITRYSINKQIHGGLEATTQGEMFSAGDPQHGHAGYVAIERVTGTLDGKQGSFVLQHMASLDASGSHMTVKVIPGSGSGDLQGITGTFEIKITDGQHNYDLTYELPQ